MKLDGGITLGRGLAGAGQEAARLESRGYDGAFTAETDHDPFLPLAVAATTTSRIELGTGIAVAFARNPMTLANIGYDLQLASQGRFILGLGSQIKPHITKRFSMPWSHPAPRMRELILAMRAIWASWNESAPLQFRGEFYRHTLMTPMFNPGPSPYGSPLVFLAAVGPIMTEVAGEVGDGLVAHAFTTPAYFRDVTLPALERGLARAGRKRTDVQISLPMFLVVGRDEREVATRSRGVRKQIAFYASTPAYKPVLDHHGWADVHTELNRLSKQGEWDAMADVIDDAILAEFAVVGPADEVAAGVGRRYGGLVDRTMFFADDGATDEAETVIEGLRAL